LVFVLEYLSFHTEVMPQLAQVGARYVVVAYCGKWRDGLTTSDESQIPALQRKLRLRFMKRYSVPSQQGPSHIKTASLPGSKDTSTERA